MDASKQLHAPKHLLIQWHITNRCNLRCGHCYQDSFSGSEPSWDNLLYILDEFKHIIDIFGKENISTKYRAHITVTGGEPFARNDFVDLLGRFAECSDLFTFAILTNGTMLNSRVVDALNETKPRFVQVSIDGSKKTHDAVRGIGNYDKAIDGIKLLVGKRIPTLISFTAHRGNFREFPQVARLGKRLGVTRVWADRMVPCSGNAEDSEMLDREETREFVELIHKERKSRWFATSKVSLFRSLQFLSSNEQPYKCSAGNTLVTVLPNGDVYPCRRMPIVAGNLFQTRLDKIYRDSDILRKLRSDDIVTKGCEKCFYSKVCNGGSRCLSAAYYGDPFRADPGCWLAAE